MSAYCDVAPGHQWHGPYHDAEYGILKKRAAFRAAYEGFVPERVARSGARDVKRLLAAVLALREACPVYREAIKLKPAWRR